LDKIIVLLIAQNIIDKNDKIYILKKIGISSDEIGDIVGIKNPRQMEGWKRK
jgi:hypothetical protein